MEIEQLSACIPSYLEYTATKQAYTYLATATATTQLETAYLVEFIEELEQKMPHAFLIDSMTVNSTGFSMNVTVKSKEEAAECIEQLRTFNCIQSLTVNGINDARPVDLPNGETVDGALAVDEEVLNAIGIPVSEEAVVTFSVEGVFAPRTSADALMDIIENSMGISMDGLELDNMNAANTTSGAQDSGQTAASDDELESDLDGLK